MGRGMMSDELWWDRPVVLLPDKLLEQGSLDCTSPSS